MHVSTRISVWVCEYRCCVYVTIYMAVCIEVSKRFLKSWGVWQILINDKIKSEGFLDGDERVCFLTVCNKQLVLVWSEVHRQIYNFLRYFSSGEVHAEKQSSFQEIGSYIFKGVVNSSSSGGTWLTR